MYASPLPRFPIIQAIMCRLPLRVMARYEKLGETPCFVAGFFRSRLFVFSFSILNFVTLWATVKSLIGPFFPRSFLHVNHEKQPKTAKTEKQPSLILERGCQLLVQTCGVWGAGDVFSLWAGTGPTSLFSFTLICLL